MVHPYHKKIDAEDNLKTTTIIYCHPKRLAICWNISIVALITVAELVE
jgi:hypothetical protein